MATYSSDLILGTGVGAAAPSVAPGTIRPVVGSVSIASNTSFGTADTLPLFTASGPYMRLSNFWIDFPALDGGSGLGMNLVDTLATPTVIVSASTTPRAGGFVTTSAAKNGTIGTGVVYTSSTTIQLAVNTSSTDTTGASATVIYFGFDLIED